MVESKRTVLEEYKTLSQAIDEVPEVAKLRARIIAARDILREMEPKMPGAFLMHTIEVIGDLDLILELLLRRATFAAYNLGFEDGQEQARENVADWDDRQPLRAER